MFNHRLDVIPSGAKDIPRDGKYETVGLTGILGILAVELYQENGIFIGGLDGIGCSKDDAEVVFARRTVVVTARPGLNVSPTNGKLVFTGVCLSCLRCFTGKSAKD